MDLNYSLDTTSGNEGLGLITAIRKLDEDLPIVVMTGWASIEVAVSTMQNGANDFIQKPWDIDRLIAIVNNQIKLVNSVKNSNKLSQQNQKKTCLHPLHKKRWWIMIGPEISGS